MPSSTAKRLTIFRELVKSCYEIPFWDYTGDMTLLTELTEKNELMEYFLRYSSVFKDLKEYVRDGGHLPLVLNDSVGLLWTAVFEYSSDALKFVHIMGSCNMNGESKKAILARMDRDELPIDIRRRLRETLQMIPVLPSTAFFMYTIMFHRCITGETISANDFEYPASVRENMMRAKERELIGSENEPSYNGRHEGISDLDRELMNVIETGNINYEGIFSTGSKISTGVKMSSFGSLRAGKDSIILFIGLCSRSAIRGGLPPEISYSLCDMYVNLTEGCNTTSELSALNHTMYDDYVRRVHAYRSKSGYSREIQACCDYIDIHLTEDISLRSLAKATGYAEYYLSRRFKKETGMAPSEYLARKKTEHARLLLETTEKSVQEISDLLHFCSPSYFSSTFAKFQGVSPTAYREKLRSND